MNSVFFIKSNQNQISRFAKAPHHQSSGAPNIMTSNRDKTNILKSSKNKREKKDLNRNRVCVLYGMILLRRERGDEKVRLEFR